MKRFLKLLGALCALLLLIWLCVLALQILSAGKATENEAADVAIVLGAAAYGDSPSPVFEERIRHGISLYRSGTVKKLLFTGGSAQGAHAAEATVAKRYAIRHGVPPDDILTETLSHTTQENLAYAHRLMLANGLHKAFIVSDPLHLKRALRMASDLQIEAHAAPTPTTRYRSLDSKAKFLLRELFFYNHYLITGR